MSGGGSVPRPQASAEDWIDMVNSFQKGALSTRLGIPLLYGIDAIHGNNNVYKATIFPHNVGLGVTRQVHFPCSDIFTVRFSRSSFIELILCIDASGIQNW